MGPAAYQFADFLAASKQRLWQVLRAGAHGLWQLAVRGTLRVFCGDPLLISLEHLSDWGWIGGERLAGMRGRSGDVAFEEVERTKMPLLEEAARNFLSAKPADRWKQFQQYCRDNNAWLDDFALYSVLRRKLNTNSWKAWPEEFAQRHTDALEKLRHDAAAEISIIRVLQFAL